VVGATALSSALVLWKHADHQFLQHVGGPAVEIVQASPSADHALLAVEVLIVVGQVDGLHVFVPGLDGLCQLEYSDVSVGGGMTFVWQPALMKNDLFHQMSLRGSLATSVLVMLTQYDVHASVGVCAVSGGYNPSV